MLKRSLGAGIIMALLATAAHSLELTGKESGGSVSVPQTGTVTVSAAAPRIASADYRSPGGEVLKASFDLDRHQVTVTLPDGRSVTLPAAQSASGARYSDGTETFWEHQGTGRFFHGETVLFEGELQPQQHDK